MASKRSSKTRKPEHVFFFEDVGKVELRIRYSTTSHANYKQGCVTYLDVLGFRNLVKQSHRNPSAITEIRRILRILRRRMTGLSLFKQYRKKYSTPMLRSFGFSDLTVRVMDLDGVNIAEDLRIYLLIELSSLANLQLELACRGHGKRPILLRGGMTIGPIDVDVNNDSDDFLFGPALVRAYELESQTAVFPRIVIDRPVVKAMASVCQKAGIQYKIIRQGEDGIYFLDYVAAAGRPKMLMYHKEMIETHLGKLAKEKAHETIVQKYLWLAKYHNSAIGGLAQSFKSENLIISEKLLG